MKPGDYCKDQTTAILSHNTAVKPPKHAEPFISLDLRSEPVDSSVDRVCCTCGESLASDGYCEQCKKHR